MEKKDFLIVYTQSDRAWAEWIAWTIEEAGYTTLLSAWDFRPGKNLTAELKASVTKSKHVMILISPSYLNSSLLMEFLPDHSDLFGEDGTVIVPVRVAPCDMPPTLSDLTYIDLVGLDETRAKQYLLKVITTARAKPAIAPEFPGTLEPEWTTASSEEHGLLASRQTATEPFRDDKDFDVYLSYNSEDRSEVEALAYKLRDQGIRPWLDVWEISPGEVWQTSLNTALRQSRSVAVIIGHSGVGPWQDLEMRALLRESVSRGIPIIPVILASVRSEPRVPMFLRSYPWVDFRRDTNAAHKRLLWGITTAKTVKQD